MRWNAIKLAVILTILILSIGCTVNEPDIEESVEIQSSLNQQLSENTEVEDSSEEAENIKENDVILDEILIPYVGLWKVSNVFCVPRMGLVSEEQANQSPIINTELIIDESGAITLNNILYEEYRKLELTPTQLMEHYNLVLGDVEKFGDGIYDLGFKSNESLIGIIITQDGQLLLQVRELYETDGFYILESVQE